MQRLFSWVPGIRHRGDFDASLGSHGVAYVGVFFRINGLTCPLPVHPLCTGLCRDIKTQGL